MQTDEKVEEMMKNERKRLFWRLYVIPWGILTLTLISIIIILYRSPSPNKTILEGIGGAITVRGYNINTNEVNETNSTSIIKIFYKEAIKAGYGEWVCDKEGEVSFKWKPCTESLITSQVNQKVEMRVKGLQESYKKNANDIIENTKKETITECRKSFQIDSVNKGVGKWVTDNNGNVIFNWKSIPEIVMEYTCTESNKLIKGNMIKRDIPFTESDYKIAKEVGIDIEGELVKRVSLGIESSFWGNEDIVLKEKVKVEVSKAIHGMFDGFESLNKTDKRYNIRSK